MAHELRTPLSTAALLGDAIQLEVQRQPDNPRGQQLDKLALRLHALVRNMNHQIDTQIANAKLLQLPRYTERVRPARWCRRSWCGLSLPVEPPARVRQGRHSRGFQLPLFATQFSQVLDNLIKNACTR
jgi:two-component system CAI-1 autoinducer sensor kinase/phosphatase CqsS